MDALILLLILILVSVCDITDASQPPVLLLASVDEIEAISTTSGRHKRLVRSLENAIDVDYSYAERKIYFTDITQHKMFE